MILFFKSWCENIIVGVVISVIIEMICPERFLKYIKVVIGVYILYLIVAPLVDKLNIEVVSDFLDEMDMYVNSNILIEENTNDKLINSNENYNKLNKTFIDGIEVTLKKKIKEELGINTYIIIEYDKKTFEINKVKVGAAKGMDIKKDTNIKLINNIILNEIDIDENLIVYD